MEGAQRDTRSRGNSYAESGTALIYRTFQRLMIERMPDYVSGYTKWGSAISLRVWGTPATTSRNGLPRVQHRYARKVETPATKETGQNSNYRHVLVRVDSCDFVDGLLRSQNIRSVKSHEITPTKPQGKLSHHSIPAAQTV